MLAGVVGFNGVRNAVLRCPAARELAVCIGSASTLADGVRMSRSKPLPGSQPATQANCRVGGGAVQSRPWRAPTSTRIIWPGP
ncbi:unnamed protein product [Parajaminaea phylloscopi]